MTGRFLSLIAMVSLLHGAPTEQREWKSTAGTSLKAVAIGIKGDHVEFTGANGKPLKVPLDKLIPADREFLLEHFKDELPKPGEPVSSKAEPAEGLAQPLGQTTAPIAASDGAHYLVYLPPNLKKDRKAPLIFFTSAGGGNEQVISTVIEGANVNGWIAATSIESKNGNDLEKNHEFTKACIKHITSTLPVDERRVYFTGTSGGAAVAFHNASLLPHAGVIGVVGYIPGAVPKGGDYVLCNGANDFNRYTSASAAKALGKKNSILRYHEAGHHASPAWLMTDAMIWLNLRHLSGKGGKLADERLDFEASILRWIAATKSAAPHRAFHAAIQMKEDFKVSSANSGNYDKVIAELGSEANLRYAEGILKIDAWSRKNLASFGGGSLMKHTTPALESSAKRLSEEFAGVPQIEEIALKLGAMTDDLGQ